jgi:uncharacterized damage-inducible protein DinB
MELDPRLEIARGQIEFARQYLLGLIADVEDDQWFRQPDGLPSHLAWQVGHVAMAEYGLVLFRQRGRHSDDTELMSSKFRKMFSRGSSPLPDPAQNPSPAEIRQVLDRVHQQAMRELAGFPAEQLDEPTEMPYAVYPTKLGALYFCAAHEMLHAGQIGILRRALGKPPLR